MKRPGAYMLCFSAVDHQYDACSCSAHAQYVRTCACLISDEYCVCACPNIFLCAHAQLYPPDWAKLCCRFWSATYTFLRTILGRRSTGAVSRGQGNVICNSTRKKGTNETKNSDTTIRLPTALKFFKISTRSQWQKLGLLGVRSCSLY